MWKPSPSDITWGRRIVSLLKEGGIWKIPDTGQRFQFFHTKKEILFLGGEMKDRWLFDRTVLCFNAIGYRVVENNLSGDRQEIIVERGRGKTR
ncbi:MAG: hypothetical protein M0R80_03060 [Proteobacteria bacterium]|jgi:hypothetical protein|nr:hypothetical protein [Pseudomonadota bacterium]